MAASLPELSVAESPASALELCVDVLASLTLVTLIIVSNEVVAVPSLALTVME